MTNASDIAKGVNGMLQGLDQSIVGVCSLRQSRSSHLGFVRSESFLNGDDPTLRGVVLLVPVELAGRLSGTCIVVDNPRQAFAQALELFFKPHKASGIAATACINPSARIAEGVAIGEYCVVGPGVEIGEGTELRHHVVLADGVRIGRNCLIKTGAVVGEEGFGFEVDDMGLQRRVHHLGSVIIGNEVEVGAHSIIARGTIDCTEIQDYVKIDDNVFIAHNCVVGRNTLVIACSEISGSVEIGANSWIGPNCSILNGVTLGEGTYLGMATGVTKSLSGGKIYVGSPARLLRVRPGYEFSNPEPDVVSPSAD